MDYFKHYIALVDSRQSRPIKKEIGYEIHHIVPKCWGGEDEEYNLVKLTYREHFLAHYFLAKSFPSDRAVNYAFLCMLRDPHGYRNLKSGQYAVIKTVFAKFQQKHFKENNPMWQKKAQKLHSDRMKVNNPMTKEPWKNHTAKPVRLHYMDGTFEDFRYMKEISLKKGISYNTLKYITRKGTGSKKHGILKLEKR